MYEMKNIINEEKFLNTSNENKIFLITFDEEMSKLNYGIEEAIDAWKWANKWINAKYQINYIRTDIKKKTHMAHIFFGEDGSIILIRLLTEKTYSHKTKEEARSFINPHSAYIETAPKHIKEKFTVKNDCHHCNENANGFCWGIDTYTIDDIVYKKCIRKGFDFFDPTIENLSDYIGLLAELKTKKTNQ